MNQLLDINIALKWEVAKFPKHIVFQMKKNDIIKNHVFLDFLLIWMSLIVQLSEGFQSYKVDITNKFSLNLFSSNLPRDIAKPQDVVSGVNWSPLGFRLLLAFT